MRNILLFIGVVFLIAVTSCNKEDDLCTITINFDEYLEIDDSTWLSDDIMDYQTLKGYDGYTYDCERFCYLDNGIVARCFSYAIDSTPQLLNGIPAQSVILFDNNYYAIY